MAAPRTLIQHTLDALKGWTDMHAVDFHAEFDASITTEVVSGTVVRLNADGKYVRGCKDTDCMPMFLFSGSLDPDVKNDGGDASVDKGVWVPIVPDGQAMALVAIGAYELLSTEFVDAAYAPNDLLTAAESGGSAGKLAAGVKYTDTICGMVSRGVIDNGHGVDALAFWPLVILAT